MERPIIQGHPDIDGRIACHKAAFHGLLDAFFDRGDIVTWDDAPDDLVDELKSPTARQWLDFEPTVTILPTPAGLALVPPLDLGRGANGLLVGDAWRLHLHLTAKVAPQAVHHHLKMLFSQPRDE